MGVGVWLGAGYRYEIPEDWNGDLVMWAHGFRGEGLELTVDNPPFREYLLENGYAWGASSYDRNGYEWDVGVHYIGDVGTKTRTRRMFDFLSDGNLHWAPMADEYDRFFVGDKVFNARAGRRAFRENLIRQFPDERPRCRLRAV